MILDEVCSEDFSLLVAFLLVTFSWLFRGFFVVFSWLFRDPLLSRKTVFGPFSLLFRGPRLGKFYPYSPWNSLLICALQVSGGKKDVSRNSAEVGR